MKNKKGHCGSTPKIQYLNLRKRQTHKNITPHIPDLERQKDRSTDNTMAKIKKVKRIEAQTIQWPK
jgi:hypothetical protein